MTNTTRNAAISRNPTVDPLDCRGPGLRTGARCGRRMRSPWLTRRAPATLQIPGALRARAGEVGSLALPASDNGAAVTLGAHTTLADAGHASHSRGRMR